MQGLHKRVTFELATLNVEGFALICLFHRRDTAIRREMSTSFCMLTERLGFTLRFSRGLLPRAAGPHAHRCAATRLHPRGRPQNWFSRYTGSTTLLAMIAAAEA
jgi:hypothetical protein